jgi:hypothetical protein
MVCDLVKAAASVMRPELMPVTWHEADMNVVNFEGLGAVDLVVILKCDQALAHLVKVDRLKDRGEMVTTWVMSTIISRGVRWILMSGWRFADMERPRDCGHNGRHPRK